jgi:HPt (histidine-containing phosphotransfer) domain-containing protein
MRMKESASQSESAEPLPVEKRPESPLPETQADAQKKLHDLLATLWEQRKSVLQERLQLLEAAIASLEGGSALEARKSGADAAHKLAGILGTFGLPRGTDLAREAELMLERDAPILPEDVLHLRVLIDELSVLIDQPSLPRSR